MLFLDGAYTFPGSRPRFHRSRRPALYDLVKLPQSLSWHVVGLLERHGLVMLSSSTGAVLCDSYLLDYSSAVSLVH